MGYAVGPGAFTIETRKSDGMQSVFTAPPHGFAADAPAAVVDSSEARTNCPAEFFTDPYVSLFWSAYTSSTYPIAPGVCLTSAVTPSLFCPPMPTGHGGRFETPTFLANSGDTLDRKSHQMYEVPEPSARRTTAMSI